MNAVMKIDERRGGSFAIIPSSLSEVKQIVDIMAQADVVPEAYKDKDPAGGKVANTGKMTVGVMAGLEVGLTPIQSLQVIMVVNGIPTLYGDGMLALVQSSGLMADFKEEIDTSTPDTPIARCRVWRKGMKTVIERTFDWNDAKRAELTGKGPWKQFPKRMLQMRARSFALRDGFADVLKGMKLPDEVGYEDPIDAAFEVVEPMPAKVQETRSTTTHATTNRNAGVPRAERTAAAASTITETVVEDAPPPVEAESYTTVSLVDEVGEVLADYEPGIDFFAGLLELLEGAFPGDREQIIENNEVQIAESRHAAPDDYAEFDASLQAYMPKPAKTEEPPKENLTPSGELPLEAEAPPTADPAEFKVEPVRHKNKAIDGIRTVGELSKALKRALHPHEARAFLEANGALLDQLDALKPTLTPNIRATLERRINRE